MRVKIIDINNLNATKAETMVNAFCEATPNIKDIRISDGSVVITYEI